MYAAKIIADSLSPHGERLTTMEVVIPRIVLAELNTHKMLSKNSASSRAMPVSKLMKMAMDDPYIPERFGINQKGMQSEEYLTGVKAEAARTEWLQARDNAMHQVKKLLDLGVHKQFTNRLLEPFLWHTCILTGTDWSNFFHLRCHPAAHPAIKNTADLMFDEYGANKPREVKYTDWHLPYFFPEDEAPAIEHTMQLNPHATCGEVTADRCRISAGRCARISYLTHDGKRDIGKDLDLYDKLVGPGHMSPLEHPARPLTEDEREQYGMHHFVTDKGHTFSLKDYTAMDGEIFNPYGTGKVTGHRTTHYCGNFDGFMQLRKTIPYEHDILAPRVSGGG